MKVLFPYGSDDLLDFEEFKHEIDTRGGYIMDNLAKDPYDIKLECEQALLESEGLRTWLAKNYIPSLEKVKASQFVQEMARLLLVESDLTEPVEESNEYKLRERKASTERLEELVQQVDNWLRALCQRPKHLNETEWWCFLKFAGKFFWHGNRLYKKA
jgi:hypothetical protein